MDDKDKSSRSSSIYRARQDSDFPVYNKGKVLIEDKLVDYSSSESRFWSLGL